ncbi:hypothetical protein [Sodalinema gerasimenkoae]|uniref:hypothetical protein n=1 Tax=Sodalinema gerasimenkoae TaxID=2862348 RepID=UPI0013573BD5|nr:hypothetical protein [Sodalinema gerasimenkoae]
MTSQVPSNHNASSFGVIRSRFLLIFGVCTIALTGYTLALQHSSDPIIWWQPDQQVIVKESRPYPGNSKKVVVDPPLPNSPDRHLKCSPKAGVMIGTIVTLGITALLIPPPIAFAAGSSAAAGLCWLIDKVN